MHESVYNSYIFLTLLQQEQQIFQFSWYSCSSEKQDTAGEEEVAQKQTQNFGEFVEHNK